MYEQKRRTIKDMEIHMQGIKLRQRANFIAIWITCNYFWAQSTVDFPIGGQVNVLSDYKETGPKKIFNTITAVIC